MRFLLRPLIRIMAFVRKELFGALRQPRLILSLVLGPFLILALFGVGYSGNSTYKTALVVPNRPGITTNTADYKGIIQAPFNLVQVTQNENGARDELNQGQIDVVIVVPSNALDEIYNGNFAKFPVYYRNLNPLQANYIEYSTYVYASEFDKVILRQALTASKPSTTEFKTLSQQLNTSTTRLDQDMQSGNIADAKLQVQTMKATVQLSRDALGSLILPGNGGCDANSQPATATPTAANNQNLGSGTCQDQKLLGGQVSNAIMQSGVAATTNDLDNINTKLNALDDGFNRLDANSAQQRANLASIRQSNSDLTQRADKIANIPPAVLVEPVLSDAKNLADTSPSYTNFYSPAVVILLLQHIAITLGSLSNVRDRLIGAIEIFRVAPIGPSQILTGKFISFMILLLAIGALLIALVTKGLGVPFINFNANWPLALGVMAATIYASIGLGFMIAGLSKTESQAVQLAMILLLASIFFSGFVVPLNQFAGYVRFIGYALPMTFGAASLQNVMLDNNQLDLFYLLMPLAIGTLYLIVGRFLYRRQFNIG